MLNYFRKRRKICRQTRAIDDFAFLSSRCLSKCFCVHTLENILRLNSCILYLHIILKKSVYFGNLFISYLVTNLYKLKKRPRAALLHMKCAFFVYQQY